MLKGHVFKFQTFANEVFAHFINTFLQGNMGVTKGCELSKTVNSVTIGAGYFCVMGRFLEIIGSETITDITNTGYYNLVCEIDLSKTNTKSELNQATIKIIRNTSGYGTLTKENLFEGGNIYQYEFARFRVTEAGIVNFQDKRTFLNLNSIYSQINNNFNNLFEQKDEAAENLIEQIRQELASVIDGSAYILKDDYYIPQIKKLTQVRDENGYINLTFKRWGRIIYVKADIHINQTNSNVFLISAKLTDLPDWAKPENIETFNSIFSMSYANTSIINNNTIDTEILIESYMEKRADSNYYIYCRAPHKQSFSGTVTLTASYII